MPTDTPETLECEQCGGARTIDESVKAYCSHECFFRAKGDGILKGIRDNHTVCSNCFAKVKETVRPSDEKLRKKGIDRRVRDAVSGWQYRTTDGTSASTITEPSTQEQRDGYSSPGAVAESVTGCANCGSLTSGANPVSETLEIGDAPAKLFSRLQEMYDSGAIDREPSELRFFEGIEQQGRDWPFVIGYALYGE